MVLSTISHFPQLSSFTPVATHRQQGWTAVKASICPIGLLGRNTATSAYRRATAPTWGATIHDIIPRIHKASSVRPTMYNNNSRHWCADDDIHIWQRRHKFHIRASLKVFAGCFFAAQIKLMFFFFFLGETTTNGTGREVFGATSIFFKRVSTYKEKWGIWELVCTTWL